MDFESEVPGSTSRKLVLILVVVGIVVLAVGAFVAFKKRSGGGGGGGGGVAAGAEGEAGKWCAMRQEWRRVVSALDADIMLKSIRLQDAAERKKLVKKRNLICQQHAEKLQAIKIADPAVQAVELGLVKAGKVRANIAVEIANILNREALSPDIKVVRAALDAVKNKLRARLAKSQKDAEGQVGALLAKIKGCSNIYQGPITDAGTSSSPYVSWKELELRLKQAEKKLDERIKQLEPMEQYGNQIYHELIRKYRAVLTGCYKKAHRRNKTISKEITILVTLKSNGNVAKLGLVSAKPQDVKVLDCLLETAAKWKLPQPAKAGDRVAVRIDFSRL